MVLHAAFEPTYQTWTMLSEADQTAFKAWLSSHGIDYPGSAQRVEVHSARGQKTIRVFDRALGDADDEAMPKAVRDIPVPAWPPLLGWTR